MSSRGSRAGWMILIPALMLGLWLLAVAVVALRGRGPGKNWHLGRDAQSARNDAARAAPVRLDDPRLSSLRHAADSWRQADEPRRLVVDQVCLVPDVPSFLEAIAAWDAWRFFPILIDEPVWVLPFVRSFRPARVVRYTGRAPIAAARALPVSPEPPASRSAEWSRALEAVAAASTGPAPSAAARYSGDTRLGRPGRVPPGLVLAAPESPMLAGAVALAAGHLQPLVRLEPFSGAMSAYGDPGGPRHFGDVLTRAEALGFARRVEDCVAALVARYGQLGDDCDFLTLAGDWPYRYADDRATGPARGVYALDDLIGRRLEESPNGSGPGRLWRRWAFTGRLLGDPAASVARAMGALFLQPRSALLWNTYGGGEPWSDYPLNPAADLLARTLPGPGAVVHRAGRQASLTAWHRTIDPVNRFGLVLINSSGGPESFTIPGGPARPGDVPRGVPSVVSMIHSFSAADPTNPQTIAGRWLAQGAFVYFGSVNEPFLPAFRTPRLVAELLAAGVPLVAALRQGEFEAFGFPWRLVYLGDPLYRIQAAAPLRQQATANVESSGSDSSRRGRSLLNWLTTWSSGENEVRAWESDRLSPSDWQAMAAGYAHWPVVEIAPPVAGPIPSPERRESDTEDERLRWCLETAIGESTLPPAGGRPAPRGAGARTGAGSGALSSNLRPVNWRPVLRQLRRDRLHNHLRPVFDDLLIDALGEIGAFDELQSRLAQIPPEECGPRVWLALETCAMGRLARLAQEGDPAQAFAGALDLWDEVLRLSWPAESPFPAQLTERVAALAAADPPRRLAAWLDRLRRIGPVLASQSSPVPRAAVVAAERARVEAQLDLH